ncbi:unnamed protein product [Clonostachys rosea f. rosea IK726]|uniref:Uncharacterized protein n=1 Tax=Clonostachys rosea f. rosea IK726 TaxID=1349383 RepID=A0ACA9TKH7_BIOOC|nr:unnamed protein product [Clonostachys rosea f. rosea IK726]
MAIRFDPMAQHVLASGELVKSGIEVRDFDGENWTSLSDGRRIPSVKNWGPRMIRAGGGYSQKLQAILAWQALVNLMETTYAAVLGSGLAMPRQLGWGQGSPSSHT